LKQLRGVYLDDLDGRRRLKPWSDMMFLCFVAFAVSGYFLAKLILSQPSLILAFLTLLNHGMRNCSLQTILEFPLELLLPFLDAFVNKLNGYHPNYHPFLTTSFSETG
jgi:hypothetical protein